MRTILIIVMSLLCLGAHAGDKSKKKPSKNLTCCKVYLKDGTVLTSSLKKHAFYNLLINNILYLCVT